MNDKTEISYDDYMLYNQGLSLNILSDEDFKLFKQSKGMGQFILKTTIDNDIIEERWVFRGFKKKDNENVNFKNCNKDSAIFCKHVYVDRNAIKIGAYPYSKFRPKVSYKVFDDLNINLPIEKKEREKNPFVFHCSDTVKNLDLKVGLYLQTVSFKNLKAFNDDMDLIRNEDIDILVFPETCFTPFNIDMGLKSIFDNKAQQEFIEKCLELSEDINKAVIVSTVDSNSVLFSVFVNANATEDETLSRIYIKHTMTDTSPFMDEEYDKFIEELFTPIIFKDISIGLTICYDCNYSPFSRIYGIQNVDLIINSTGGDIIYDKWYKYNKARAIENKCFNLVTMGGWEENKKKNFTYAFNPNGGLILPTNMYEEDKPSKPGKIYIYDLSSCNLNSTTEKSINQTPKISKHIHFEIPVGNSDDILNKSRRIKDNLYVYSVGKFNVIFCIVNGNDIIKPEKVIPLLYDSDLNEYKNRKYVIINKHKEINQSFYSDYLSIILKVRSMENFAVVLLESDNINMCYQAGATKSLQVIEPENDMYGIDLKRAGGPDAIWRNKGGMRKNWRINFEKLIDFMVKKTK